MRFRNARLRTKITALLLSLAALWGVRGLGHTPRGREPRLGLRGQQRGRPADRRPTTRTTARTPALDGAPRQPWPRTARGAGRPAPPHRPGRRQVRQALPRRQRQAGRERGAQAGRQRRAGEVLRPGRQPERDRLRPDAPQQDGVGYTDAIDSIFVVDDSLATLDDKGFAQNVRTVVGLNRARELLSQEDAQISGILAARRFSTADYTQFVQAVGAQRYAMHNALEELRTPTTSRTTS